MATVAAKAIMGNAAADKHAVAAQGLHPQLGGDRMRQLIKQDQKLETVCRVIGATVGLWPATVRKEAASSGEEAAPELPQVQYPESPFREGVTPGSEAGGAESKGTNDLACALCSPLLLAY